MGHPMKRRRKKPKTFLLGTEHHGSSPIDPPEVRAEKQRLVADYVARVGALRMVDGIAFRVKHPLPGSSKL